MALQDTLEQINNFDINDADWSRVGVWPLAGRLCIFGGAIIAVLALAYFFFVKDLQTTLGQEIDNEQMLRDTFESKTFQAAALDQYRGQMVQMEKDFAFLIAQLPKKTQVPGLIDDIDEKGRLSGLSISSIKLKPENVGEFYVTLPIDILVEGSYHDLGAFVSGIAGMSRIVTLHDFSIASGADPLHLKMSIQARTYRSIDDKGR